MHDILKYDHIKIIDNLQQFQFFNTTVLGSLLFTWIDFIPIMDK